MSDNITGSKTEVEISHIKAGEKGDLGLNFVITSHKNGEESGMPNFIQAQLKHGYTLRELNHSHAKNSQASMIWNKDKLVGGDVMFADDINNIYLNSNKITFKIYHVPSKKYYKYYE